MRRQIFFFHMVTLILALLTLLTVSGGVLHLVFRAYQDQAVPAADSRSDQVQSTLASWPEEARDWWELDQSLAKLDYRLAVEQNHQVVYSSLNRFQEDLYNRIFANASWPESGTLSLQDQGVFIVGRRCGDAVLVAMMEPQTPEMFGQQRPQNEAALISFSVIGLAAIIIGEVLLGRLVPFYWKLIAVVAGSVIYQIIRAVVLRLGFDSDNMKALTAIIVVVALAIPVLMARYRQKMAYTEGGEEEC